MRVLPLLLAAGVACCSDVLELDRPLVCESSRDILQYDDGTANWLTWGGLYRGVFFDLNDFYVDPVAFYCDSVEFWFFHHASYPWDVASFYAELYEGDASAPVTQLNQTSVTATHYSPCYAEYSAPITLPVQFWVIVNTEMSGGGWPALLGDNSPQPVTSHSFFSDDFIVWEPWVIGGPNANDYFVRVYGTPVLGLEESTWGSLKTLWQ